MFSSQGATFGFPPKKQDFTWPHLLLLEGLRFACLSLTPALNLCCKTQGLPRWERNPLAAPRGSQSPTRGCPGVAVVITLVSWLSSMYTKV